LPTPFLKKSCKRFTLKSKRLRNRKPPQQQPGYFVYKKLNLTLAVLKLVTIVVKENVRWLFQNENIALYLSLNKQNQNQSL
jgi:hypothetical protein